jgi:uncharacterized protein (DUF427 family)
MAVEQGGTTVSDQVRDLLARGFGELRYEPTAKRIRAVLGGDTVVDSTRAVLVWEPRRIVPSYAVPPEDVRGELVPAGAAAAGPDGEAGVRLPDVTALRVLDPRVPFAVHSTEGEVTDLRAGGQHRPGAGFRPADPDLAALVILDFGAFDAWYEEDELNVGHPRDPFHRIDVLPSSRPVRLELDGQVLAVSSRPTLLFEAMLPTRYYLPRADVTAELIPQRDQDLVRLQRAGVVLLGVGGRPARPGHRLDVHRAAARRRPGPRPDRVLRRADRRGAGRRTPGSAGHALVGRAGYLAGTPPRSRGSRWT